MSLDELINLISDEFLLNQRDVRHLLVTAPARYKVHMIEKRHGRGKREIAQPTKEIKAIQKFVLTSCLGDLKIHEAAKAYRKGTSIKQHAEMHVRNSYLLKLDFKDFFPSITGEDLATYFLEFVTRDTVMVNLLCRLFLFEGKPRAHLRLSIGAPSSPCISNAIMYPFDCELDAHCKQKNAVYSRYADDIAISTNEPRTLDEIKLFVEQLCKRLSYPRLRLNTDKTVFTSKKRNRHLTGLVLSNSNEVSIGREQKRLIRAMAHRYSFGDLDQAQTARLRGLLAFAWSIEPRFVDTVQRMIGADMLDQLKRATNPEITGNSA